MGIDNDMRQISRTTPYDQSEAQVREQLANEMEQQLIAQEIELEHDTGTPIAEQAYGLEHPELGSGEDVISAEGDHPEAFSGAQSDDGHDAGAWVDPGAGTDEDQPALDDDAHVPGADGPAADS
jgi:hypothetical protein